MVCLRWISWRSDSVVSRLRCRYEASTGRIGDIPERHSADNGADGLGASCGMVPRALVRAACCGIDLALKGAGFATATERIPK